MALDQALLDAAVETNLPTLRFYQWQRPTLSLGYFQRYADRKQHAPSLEADVVRRLSGGGAILHDREVTYSLVLPVTHPLASDTQALYRAVHKAIVRFLSPAISGANLPTQLALCKKPSAKKPFLCFQRRALGDLLLLPANVAPPPLDYKIGGSAQRRRRGAVLQHGSLLLEQSPLAPELLGLNDVAQIALDVEDLLARLPTEIGLQLNLSLQPSSSAEMQPAAEKLLESRYARSTWSQRR